MKEALVKIEWKDTKTGQVGTFTSDTLKVSWDEDNQCWELFWWVAGNAACDCNREILFLGTPASKTSCGDGRFKLLKVWVKPLDLEEWELLRYSEKEVGD